MARPVTAGSTAPRVRVPAAMTSAQSGPGSTIRVVATARKAISAGRSMDGSSLPAFSGRRESNYAKRRGTRLRILLSHGCARHDVLVDRTDRAIIEQRRRDARLANTELADRVGLTPSPCLRRVRRLENEGIILGYHARIAPAALGRGFEVHVEFDLANQAKG